MILIPPITITDTGSPPLFYDSSILEPSPREANGITALTITNSTCTGGDVVDAVLIFTGSAYYGNRAASGKYTIVSHVITSITLTDGGAGYSALPTVTTQPGDGGVITATWEDVNYRGEWHSTANYAFSINAIVSYVTNHKLYLALKNMASAYIPGAAGNTAFWQDYGATERWKPFDGVVGAQAMGTNTITYELDPGPIDSVTLHNIEADNVTVTMTDVGGAGSPVVWHEHTLTDGLFVSDIAKTDFPLTYNTPHLVIVLDYTGFTPLVGEIVVGQKEEIGKTLYNASVGIIDYSVKEVDAFGNYTVLERAYSKRMTADAKIQNTELDSIYNVLAENRAKACVWVGTTMGYASMIVYGFYKDFSIEIPYNVYSICSMEIEGLV